MGGNDNSGGFSFSDAAKAIWNKLPPNVKLYIIGGIAAVVLILIIVSAALGLSPSVFLDYSEDVSSSNVKTEYEMYWANFCEEGDTECSEEQIKAAQELMESQEAFYDKLDSLASKYNLSKVQKYIVLTTIFYNYNIDDFTAGNDAFTLDDNTDIDYEVGSDDYDSAQNIYKRETDSLKELIKQFQIEAAYCRYSFTTTGGETSTTEYAIESADGKFYTLNFFDKVQMALGFNPEDDSFASAKSYCENTHGGSIVTKKTTDTEVSIEAFYDYLRESTYFDDKEHLSSFFKDYATSHNISPDTTTWTDEELLAVREDIIKDIQDIVEDYMEQNDLTIQAGTGTRYWFPIGSVETSEENGVIFASGDPQYAVVTSPYGNRVHPVYGNVRFHSGVDLDGDFNTNIIASMGGTVVNLYNGCDSYSSQGCGGGYGNYIEIQDVKGNITLYAHMYKDKFTVAIGDTVLQGQKIGEMGSSGTSTGSHLHFEIKINGSTVDPLEYIDPNNPRPATYGDLNFNSSPYSKEEFAAILKEYYSQDGVCNSTSAQYVNGCSSFQHEVLVNNGAEKIYEIATNRNLNPELVVARSTLEGYSPGTNYNYFGYSCYNTGGLAACTKFTSFSSAMEAFFDNIAQYDSVESMMSRYAYLGDYWYTGTHWDWGGCAYASYIYPDAVPDRVANACAKADGYCSISNTKNCEPTTQEDLDAYTRWQVLKMDEARDKIFE